MRRQPRLLLLGYYFPPSNAIGAVRAFNIAKWLSRRGWEVDVVTPSPEVWRTSDGSQETALQFSREGIRCIWTEHRWRILSPGHLASRESLEWGMVGGFARRAARVAGLEREVGWMREAERACSVLAKDDVDVILATGTPFGSFEVAGRLAERLGRPFVMDYRDLWTANPHSRKRPRESTLEKERRLLARCAAAVAVSPGVAEVLRSHSPEKDRVHVVTNGYDPEELTGVVPQPFDHFAIVYAGVFYPPKRVITPVMAALRRLKTLLPAGSRPWAFHYYGEDADHVRLEAARHGVEAIVVLHGLRPRREVLSAVKGAGVSVVVASVNEVAERRERGIVTGKVFDAIGLGTPMLVVAPRGSDLESIVRNAGRGQCFTGNQPDEMAAFLAALIEGRVPPAAHPEIYAWPNMVAELEAILLEACASDRRPSAAPRAASATLRRVEGATT